jgi:predicted molibdopterin-dependent oxidoreductase YjgC
LDACRDGRIRFLYLCNHDLTLAYPKDLVSKSLEALDCVVYHGAFDHATAELARVCLPSAVYAEKAGTFTNTLGRVQRFHAAISPRDQALTDLEIIARLADALNAPLPRASAEQIFKEIGLQAPAFAGMTYQTLGALGQLLKTSQ